MGFSCLHASTLRDPIPPDHCSAGTGYVVQYSGCIFIIPAWRTSAEGIYHPYKCVTVYELWSELCGPVVEIIMNQQQLYQLQQGGRCNLQLSLEEILVYTCKSQRSVCSGSSTSAKSKSQCVSAGNPWPLPAHLEAALQNPRRGHSWKVPLTPQRED